MIVIQRNGQATVITGWRAWLVGAVAFVVATLLMAVMVFVMLGVAITVGAVLMIVDTGRGRPGADRLLVPPTALSPLPGSAPALWPQPLETGPYSGRNHRHPQPEMNRAPVRGPERCLCQKRKGLTSRPAPSPSSGPPSFNRSSRRQATRATVVQSSATTAILLAFTGSPPVTTVYPPNMPSFPRTPQDLSRLCCAISARLMQMHHDSGRLTPSCATSHTRKKNRAHPT